MCWRVSYGRNDNLDVCICATTKGLVMNRDSGMMLETGIRSEKKVLDKDW